MNRCCSLKDLKNPITSERKRVNQISPILKKADIMLDIHSTTHPSWSMLIYTKKSLKKFQNVFNVDEVYINLSEKVLGKPLLDVVERNGWVGIGIETGCQQDKTGYKVGIENVFSLLINLGMIDKKNQKKNPKRANKAFEIIDSIVIKTKTFKPAKLFKNLDLVKKWTLIAFDGVKNIYAKQDCYTIMPALHSPWEEYCFIAKKILLSKSTAKWKI